MDPGGVGGIRLHASPDPVHHRDRFEREVARRAFGREHHRVGPVVDGVGDVADFGAGRGRSRNHAFEHLGRNHHRLAQFAGAGDDSLLKRRNPFGRKLDPQVAARNHHRVGVGENALQPLDRRGLLDLDHQPGLVADEGPRLGDVLGPLDERQRDIVGPLIERELKVRTVLLGQRWDRDEDIGDVDPLIVADLAADLDDGLDPVGRDRRDPELDLAVVDQQPVAFADRFEQFGMGKLDPVLIAGFGRAIENEAASGFDRYRAAADLTDPKLGALEVEQDGSRPVELGLERADRLDQRDFSSLVAVAHVDPEGIGARRHQLGDHFAIVARWTQRCENSDLAPARHHRHRHNLLPLKSPP